MRRIKAFFLVVLFFSSYVLFAQDYKVSGYVIDSATHEPLAFVNILLNEGIAGGMTDIDGYFNLRSDQPVTKLKLSYVGYSSQEYITKEHKNLIIVLSPTTYNLQEVVVIAGENPAHRIIKNVLRNRLSNDPAHLKSFSYSSYDKMIFTAIKDTLPDLKPDSLNPAVQPESDTNDIQLQELLRRQHLFMMESVAQHKYLFPDKHYDKVIATKVSGMSDPLFVFLLSTSQPSSFYEENISIAGKNYLNPINDAFDRNYNFRISDTLFNNLTGDTTFIISFKPKKGRNFDGLKGLLYISTNKWAIANVIAEPANEDDSFTIRIQQMYQLLNGNQWFPVQLNTDIVFNNMTIGSGKPMAIGKSYRKDIVLKPEFVKREFDNVAVEVVPEANHRNEAFWNMYRNDSLSLIEKNTYHVIDSLGKARHLDRMSKLIFSLSSGRLPIGKFDIDLNRIYRYNLYEKSYAGLGIVTNESLSGVFSAGGYWGYGFGDKTAKYGGSLSITPLKYDRLQIKAEYRNDLDETGGRPFFDDKVKLLGDEGFRTFYISQWDKINSLSASVTVKIFRYITAAAGVRQVEKEAMYNYSWAQPFGDVSVLTDKHLFGTYFLGLRYAYGEKYIRNQHTQASLGTKYPVVWFQYTNAVKGFLGSDFNYNRFDLKATWSVYTKLAGKTSVTVNAGLVDRDLPLSELYNGKGSAGSGFTMYSSGSFSTMKPSEFISDRYASVFILHDFGKLLFRSKIFDPEVSLALNAGIGSLEKPANHRDLDFKTMEQGYYEGGIIVNNIIRSTFSGIGIALFQRLGPYSDPDFSKNLMFRLSLRYSI